MSRVSTPEPTPDGPAFEGRPLPRPEEEIVDQGAGFDVATLLSRRGLLSALGIGAGAFALAACTGGSDSSSTTAAGSGATTTAGEIPEETNGPYPADGTADLNILQESGIVRSDITSSLDGGETVAGVPLTMNLTVLDLLDDGAPFAGAAVYVWHCDAEGRYSMYTEGVEDQTWLRGVQIADADGQVTFRTIVPGCYQGRWTHIHFEVYPDAESATEVANVIATSQLAFPTDLLADVYALDAYAGSTENLAGVGSDYTDDSLFSEGDNSLQMPDFTGDAGSGYTGSLQIGIDTSTEPGGAGMGGDMGGGPGGPGGDGGGDPGGVR